MSVNRGTRQKSLWLRIAGPQAFNPYSLVLVSTVATIGTLSIYASYDAQNFLVTLAILAIVQLFALLPLLIIAPIVRSIPVLLNRFAAVMGSYILVNVIRSVLLDTLLVNWGIETESRLAFRLYSNVIFLSLLMAALAWGADLVAEDIAQVRVDEELITTNKQKLASAVEEIEQARTYVSRELSLEISATQTELENFRFKQAPAEAEQETLKEFHLLLEKVSKKLSDLTKNFPSNRISVEIEDPVRYSFKKILDASTYVNPYVPQVMGGLSFVALAGWLGYFVDRLTAIQWAAYLGVYSFLVYWLYRKFLVPRMRKRTVLIRLLIFEVSLAPFIFFWLALLGFIAGDDSETYGIAAANSISVFVFANIATFASGVLAAASEYREELEKTSRILSEEIRVIQEVKTREENVWKEFFAGDISKSPTTATVRLRDAITRPDGPDLTEVLPSVMKIWQNVLLHLSEV